jgi:hypothetical protein
MENPPQQLNHPITMRKRGLSPEETKEIVSSKADQIFQVLLADGANIIRSRREVVSRCISYSITQYGYMDDQRLSASVWQDLGIVPAPLENDNGKRPGPQKVNDENRVPQYPGVLENTKIDSQIQLFNMLQESNLLGQNIIVTDNGFLEIEEQQLSDVQVCNELDDVTGRVVGMHVQGNGELQQQHDVLKIMIRNCLKTTISRIALKELNPDDICTQDGYTIWKTHSELVASFATLAIALDFLGGHNFIPNNIVPLQF